MYAAAVGRSLLSGFVLGLALTGCAKESRSLGPTPPQTAPRGAADARIRDYEGNAYQVSQGGTYFSSYGCTGCHQTDAPDLRGAKLPTGGSFDRIYRAIAQGHGGLGYGARVPVEQLWQLTAFVADLPSHTPDKRHRQSVDQAGEPQGAAWPGPLR